MDQENLKMKTYIVCYNDYYVFAWEIDLNNSKATESIKQSVEFWTGWEHRLELNDGDYITTFFKQITIEVIRESFANNYNKKGVISAIGRREGYPPIDGSQGIKLIRCDNFDIEDKDLVITSMTTQQD